MPPASIRPGISSSQSTRDGQAGAHRHRADRAPDDRAALQRFRQVARGERDDDRVVAGEHQVDDDDRGEGGPEFGGQEHAPILVGRAARKKIDVV